MKVYEATITYMRTEKIEVIANNTLEAIDKAKERLWLGEYDEKTYLEDLTVLTEKLSLQEAKEIKELLGKAI